MPGDPLRILQLYPKGDFFTGAAIQLHELAVALAARGHDVTIATPAADAWAARCRAAGLRHLALPMHRPFDPRAAWRLARFIRRQRVQVAHAHKGRARTLAILAGLMGGRALLVLNRGVSFPVTGVRRFGYTSARVHAIVAVCDSIKRGLVAAGVAGDKIEVVYSGTDVDRFHPGVDGAAIRRELGVTASDLLVTQVGVRSWRGWTDVVTAMADVVAREPRARLLFVGVPAPRVAEVAARAAAAGIAGDRVLTLGHRTDVPAILCASDVVVDASYAGAGITGSIREALACERPVVATAVEGMPELVRDGETGRLVPPRDPAALAAAILATLADPTAAQAMARAGRKRVEAHFSLRAKVDALETLYRRLVARRGPA
jgi:glycosyltransferase involved in cell wall biosynthesis